MRMRVVKGNVARRCTISVFKLCELSEVATFVFEWLGKGVEYGIAGVSYRDTVSVIIFVTSVFL